MCGSQHLCSTKVKDFKSPRWTSAHFLFEGFMASCARMQNAQGCRAKILTSVLHCTVLYCTVLPPMRTQWGCGTTSISYSTRLYPIPSKLLGGWHK